MPGETLFICASMLFFIGCNLRRALFKVLMLLPIRNQDFIISHKWHVHPHVKNKSLWDSSSCLQNTQVGLIWINLNLSRVRNLPKTTNHSMKLYLGRDHYSQTTLCHEMIEPTGWKKLYAWARKGPSPLNQLLINVMLALGLPQCWERMSLTEIIDFHNGEECWWAWAV
jgi:hypothetical protein